MNFHGVFTHFGEPRLHLTSLINKPMKAKSIVTSQCAIKPVIKPVAHASCLRTYI